MTCSEKMEFVSDSIKLEWNVSGGETEIFGTDICGLRLFGSEFVCLLSMITSSGKSIDSKLFELKVNALESLKEYCSEICVSSNRAQ